MSISPITGRILAVNLLALGILVAGLLYLGEYRRSLIKSELAALRIQAEMFAVALAEGSNRADGPAARHFLAETVAQMVDRLVETTGARARVFSSDGGLVSDSDRLLGRRRMVQVEILPPPDEGTGFTGLLLDTYDALTGVLLGNDDLPPYQENPQQRASDYAEVIRALNGEGIGALRSAGASGMVLSVAVPVQRYKRVLGAVMLSKGSRSIDLAVFEVRRDILGVFAVSLAITVLLSLYLARTIARPLRRLAVAAERVRRGHHREHRIPDFAGRKDEIGELARGLKDMTETLWERMDAIESFAADVAHEIKNPLTSLRSAVETIARVKEPDQQRQLMTIIEEDVRRLDRLIGDISDFSRLDAELSRADPAPVDLEPMLAALADVHGAPANNGDDEGGIRVIVDREPQLVVPGLEASLSRVFHNLIGNAVSFSPPGGTVTITAAHRGGRVEISVEDEGPGIPEGSEDRIFQRFYTRRPDSEKFGTHSGLGLSISRQIVEAHGGTVFAENRDGGGARFVVRLPEK